MEVIWPRNEECFLVDCQAVEIQQVEKNAAQRLISFEASRDGREFGDCLPVKIIYFRGSEKSHPS